MLARAQIVTRKLYGAIMQPGCMGEVELLFTVVTDESICSSSRPKDRLFHFCCLKNLPAEASQTCATDYFFFFNISFNCLSLSPLSPLSYMVSAASGIFLKPDAFTSPHLLQSVHFTPGNPESEYLLVYTAFYLAILDTGCTKQNGQIFHSLLLTHSAK